MITRGHLIGEIIDGLTAVSQQVSTRCQLGLTDLNRYLEDFFRDFLNAALSLNLHNLNEQRSNAPGIDLGDKVNSIAFQITSSKTSEKVNKTLRVISKGAGEYENNFVLVIGKKQTKYSLEKDLCEKLGFLENDIWDIDDLCRKTISLPLDELQALYEIVRQNLTRVRIELEIPDEDGAFETSIDTYIEKIPKPHLPNFAEYCRYQKAIESAYDHSPEQVRKHFEEFSAELSNLPRITREFYSFLLERREKDDKNTPSGIGYAECLWFNYNKLKRICSFPDLEEELVLLDEHRFADIELNTEPNESHFVRIFAPIRADGFIYELVEYIDAKGIGYRKPIVSLDFSGF